VCHLCLCCSMLQCVAVRGGVLQSETCQKRPAHMKKDLCKSASVGRLSEGLLRVCRVCVYCNVLQCVAVCCSVSEGLLRVCHVCVCCSALQCVTVHCTALQCIAVCCSVLKCVSRSFGSV